MFKNPFSFDGRIRRLEYGLSLIAYIIVYILVASIAFSGDDTSKLILVLLIPMLWFYFAQGAKRCHDISKSGWFQLIPFFFLWMLFQEGHNGVNEHGNNPKG